MLMAQSIAHQNNVTEDKTSKKDVGGDEEEVSKRASRCEIRNEIGRPLFFGAHVFPGLPIRSRICEREL